MTTDRFGNAFAPALPYARGKILASTEDDYRKLLRAWAIIRRHGPEAIFIFSGLERSGKHRRLPLIECSCAVLRRVFADT
jgi:hypothetical protein